MFRIELSSFNNKFKSWLSLDKMWVCRAEDIFITFLILPKFIYLSFFLSSKIPFNKLSMFFCLLFVLYSLFLVFYFYFVDDIFSDFISDLWNLRLFNLRDLFFKMWKLSPEKCRIWLLSYLSNNLKIGRFFNFSFRFYLIPV